MTSTPEAEIARDRWGRPLIAPPGGGKPIAYTRVSTLAKTLDEPSALIQWKARMTALGMARSPHLALELQGLDAISDDPVSEHRRSLNVIVDKALQRAGADAAASIGTALHALTQGIDEGMTVRPPAEWTGHIEAYRRATAPLAHLSVEQFVVNDAIQVAGTFDRLVRLPDGRVVVADLKTGAHDPDYPLALAIQLASYARGARYDAATGERTPIHDDLDTSVGLLIHLPAKASVPRCDLYLVNLDAGWQGAQVAAAVRRLRKAPLVTPHELSAAGAA